MLTTTHLIIAVLMGLLMNLDRNEWATALTFGVAVDADHLFAAPRYVDANGWSALFAPTWDDGSGHQWKSLFHYPMGAAIVGPLAIGWRYLVPLTFWGTHVFVDHFQTWTMDYWAPIEAATFAAASAGIVTVCYIRWSGTSSEQGLPAYARHVWGRMSSALLTRG